MTVLTIAQTEAIWVFAGGAESRKVMMTAVAISESSLNSTIVSPAGAIGLWQIMPFWAGHFGWPVSNLYQTYYNARAAVSISGNGTNVAAWDSCYADIYSSGRLSYLSWPQAGSAAARNLALMGGGGGPGGGPGEGEAPPANIQAAASSGWSDWQYLIGKGGSYWRGQYNWIKQRAGELIVK